MQRYRVKNLAQFESRRRGEIRLSDNILRDPRFAILSRASRWTLIELMLMAARSGNRLTVAPDFDEDMRPLADVGLLEAIPDEKPATEDRKASRYIPDDVRVAVMVRDNGRCSKCGRIDDLQVDHIVPVSKGGQSVESNLALLCGRCNRRKSDKHRGSFV